jgi:hypothetical protein
MTTPNTNPDPNEVLHRSLSSGRIHSAYLISGAGRPPRDAAEWFARALACTRDDSPDRPCEQCDSCRKSRPLESPIELDSTGKSGPLYRHIGEHPDLTWVERAPDSTRVRIGQIRALQHTFRLGANEGGRRVGVIADAEWMNVEAQNALLRLLEEPPDRTSLILVTRTASTIITTIRSRCVRIIHPAEERVVLRGPDATEETAALIDRFDGIEQLALPDLLDWAEEYRGPRAATAERVELLLGAASAWLRECTENRIHETDRDVHPLLDAYRDISSCRRDLVQRNANPQMVAERSLFAVRGAVGR